MQIKKYFDSFSFKVISNKDDISNRNKENMCIIFEIDEGFKDKLYYSFEYGF